MKISLQWLARYLDLSGLEVAQITDALPMIGLEVESVASSGLPPLDQVVIGRILSFDRHPKADRLSVCQVDTGEPTGPRQIVCGAKNFQTGDLVPVALPGAVLPGGFEIKVSKLRDVDSHGMMCSARELGLGADHEGLLILTPRGLPVGSPLNAHFPPADTVLDISVTANRGDCLGHLGVARDLAAYFRRPLQVPSVQSPPTSPTAAAGSLLRGVESRTDACPYYTATVIRDVKIAPSPDWLRRDLEAVGQRPINNVVDITNWVMLESGQPLHTFDAARIGGGQIVVRLAEAGERIRLLDGRDVALEPVDCVIADANKPLVIAGIMGGEDSGVSEATTDLVLEAAWFRPGAVRKTSRRLGVSTDSSQRFTRDVDPGATVRVAQRAVDLILEYAGGRVEGPMTIAGAPPRGDRAIALTGDYVRARSGCAVEDAAILDVFTRLGFGVETVSAGATGQPAAWRITVPSFRSDVDRPIDLVEEFVRIYGTEAIPSGQIPAPAHVENDAPLAVFTRRAASQLVGAGFAECCHYTLRDGREIEDYFGAEMSAALALANPLTSELGHIRPSLIPGLLDALKLNLAGHNAPRRFFEIGRVFRPGRDGVLRELTSVAFVILAESVERTWRPREAADFFLVKKLALDIAALAGIQSARMLFQPATEAAPALWQRGHAALAEDRARQAEIACGFIDARKARAADIKQTVVAGEILLTREVLAAAPKRVRFQAFSLFPPVSRDLALVVDAATPAGDLAAKLKATASKIVGKAFGVESVTVFDVYQGQGLPEGKKSLAFSLVFRSPERTLTDDEVNAAFAKLQAELLKTTSYQIRK